MQDNELRQISKKIREADDNRAQPGQISISYQAHTESRNSDDNASKEWVIAQEQFAAQYQLRDVQILHEGGRGASEEA